MPAKSILSTISVFIPFFPCNYIATGNKQTLSIPDIRERAIAFHHQYYLASNMQLVILSGYAYPQMREYVESLFSSMPTCDVVLPTLSVCDDDDDGQ